MLYDPPHPSKFRRLAFHERDIEPLSDWSARSIRCKRVAKRDREIRKDRNSALHTSTSRDRVHHEQNFLSLDRFGNDRYHMCRFQTVHGRSTQCQDEALQSLEIFFDEFTSLETRVSGEVERFISVWV
jgi:hypothetical protein